MTDTTTDKESSRQLMVMLALDGQQQVALNEYDTLVAMLDDEFAVPPMAVTISAYERIVNQAYKEQVAQQFGEIKMNETTDTMSLHLPTFTQPIIGRLRELGTLLHQLQNPDCRLLTITGLGGTGKTYLAVEMAKKVLQQQTFGQGVVYISLAGVQSTDRFPEAFVQALSLVLTDNRDALTQVCGYLESKEMLIVLDSVEHLLVRPQTQRQVQGQSQRQSQRQSYSQSQNQSATQMISHIMRAAPDVKFLVTSRQPLQMQQEHLFSLAGMTVPALHSSLTPAELIQIDAIQLFQQAAKQTNVDFAVTAENQQAVIAFCRLVQGTPLAIVLGAAHMDFLTPEELLAECLESLDVLETTWTDLPDRQRSVRAVFEYSWRLLDTPLQEIFQKLAVFRGGFTREAARTVVGVSLPQLKHLHTHSLIAQIDKGRYEIHELLRQFGEEKLDTDKLISEQEQSIGRIKQRSVYDKHMHYYLTWLAEQTETIQGEQPHEAVTAIAIDQQNIQQAWTHGVAVKAIEQLAASRKALSLFYEIRGLYQEAVDRFSEAINALQPHMDQITTTHISQESIALVELYCLLLCRQDFFYLMMGGRQQVEQSVATIMDYVKLLPESSATRFYIQSRAYWTWALAFNRQNNYTKAYDSVEQALVWAEQAKNPLLVADCLYLRGLIYFYLDYFTKALRDAHDAYNRYREANHRWEEILCLRLLGIVKEWLGEYAMARIYYEEVVQLSDEVGVDPRKHLINLCRVTMNLGHYGEAERMGQQALQFFVHMNHREDIANANYHLSMIYTKLGIYQTAIEYIEQAIQVKRSREATVAVYLQSNLIYNGLGDYERALGFTMQAKEIADQLDLNFLQAEVSMYTAYTLNLLGDTQGSMVAYQQALDFYADSERDYTEIEIMAALAHVLCEANQQAVAISYIEDVLVYLKKNSKKIDIFLKPTEVYLNCYHVLQACEDPRATDILNQGYELLQTYVDKITNMAWAASFQENIAAHKEIAQLWQDLT
ncbi:MAG: NB-ARC domain-containing protein [Chloroflexota bacterium]